MNDLGPAIATVRARIAKFGGQTIGEENTKHALIEPILRALGWDVEDLDDVRCEYKPAKASNPVDYALFVHDGWHLLIEAKALGENLSKYENQVMGYAGVAGTVEWIVLTDGNEYRIYNAHAQVPINEKLFRRVVVTSEEPGLAEALWLLSKEQLRGTVIDSLWNAHHVDRKVKKVVEGLVGPDAPKDFISLVRKRVPELSPADISQSLGRATLALDYAVFKTAPPAPLAPKAPMMPSATTAKAATFESATNPVGDKTPWRHVTLKDLISSGTIVLPLEIEATYKGQRLTARIEAGGTVTWNGTAYATLSIAGGMAKKSVGAPSGRDYPSTNGWTFWWFKDSDGQLVLVDLLRQRHFAQ
jgi:hypothetical protein